MSLNCYGDGATSKSHVDIVDHYWEKTGRGSGIEYLGLKQRFDPLEASVASGTQMVIAIRDDESAFHDLAALLKDPRCTYDHPQEWREFYMQWSGKRGVEFDGNFAWWMDLDEHQHAVHFVPRRQSWRYARFPFRMNRAILAEILDDYGGRDAWGVQPVIRVVPAEAHRMSERAREDTNFAHQAGMWRGSSGQFRRRRLDSIRLDGMSTRSVRYVALPEPLEWVEAAKHRYWQPAYSLWLDRRELVRDKTTICSAIRTFEATEGVLDALVRKPTDELAELSQFEREHLWKPTWYLACLLFSVPYRKVEKMIEQWCETESPLTGRQSRCVRSWVCHRHKVLMRLESPPGMDLISILWENDLGFERRLLNAIFASEPDSGGVLDRVMSAFRVEEIYPLLKDFVFVLVPEILVARERQPVIRGHEHFIEGIDSLISRVKSKMDHARTNSPRPYSGSASRRLPKSETSVRSRARAHAAGRNALEEELQDRKNQGLENTNQFVEISGNEVRRVDSFDEEMNNRKRRELAKSEKAILDKFNSRTIEFRYAAVSMLVLLDAWKLDDSMKQWRASGSLDSGLKFTRAVLDIGLACNDVIDLLPNRTKPVLAVWFETLGRAIVRIEAAGYAIDTIVYGLEASKAHQQGNPQHAEAATVAAGVAAVSTAIGFLAAVGAISGPPGWLVFGLAAANGMAALWVERTPENHDAPFVAFAQRCYLSKSGELAEDPSKDHHPEGQYFPWIELTMPPGKSQLRASGVRNRIAYEAMIARKFLSRAQARLQINPDTSHPAHVVKLTLYSLALTDAQTKVLVTLVARVARRDLSLRNDGRLYAYYDHRQHVSYFRLERSENGNSVSVCDTYQHPEGAEFEFNIRVSAASVDSICVLVSRQGWVTQKCSLYFRLVKITGEAEHSIAPPVPGKYVSLRYPSPDNPPKYHDSMDMSHWVTDSDFFNDV